MALSSAIEQPNGASQLHSRKRQIGALLIGTVMIVVALWLTGGGLWLVMLGGSAYYLAAGVACSVAGACYVSSRPRLGFLIYLLFYAGTWAWSIWEVGSDSWQILARTGGPSALWLVTLLHFFATRSGRRSVSIACWGVAIVGVAVSLFMMTRMPPIEGGSGLASHMAQGMPDDWMEFGRDAGGSRFSPAMQITPQNVAALKPAWTYRSGDQPSAYPDIKSFHTAEATPIKVDDTLYGCTPHNKVFAVDIDTGKPSWTYDPKLNADGVALLICRGVSYYKGARVGTAGACTNRILTATMDARLIALDAATGKPCAGFGRDGVVSLLEGLTPSPNGIYGVTSPPQVIGDVAIVGGWVFDGVKTGEPAGVVRAFDVITGKLRWAWDPGRAEENVIPATPTTFTPGSPNSWSVMSADPALGLVYLPMGNATPDYFGGHRSAMDDRYSSSVVALDARTGQRRWHFQTVHHDLWDYDIGSQPVLFDMPMPGGASIPALAQATKQGDIYILDRRTGKPLTAVVERAAPQGHIAGERYSPTQPWSTGFPSLSPPPLRESDMWGASPLDQLWCRIRYRSLDYQGKYTPPSLRGSLQYPGNFGVMDWGSVTIDTARKTLYVNSSYMPSTVQMMSREEADRRLAAGGHESFSPQSGTPYGASPAPFLSPIGLPCNAPPWGRLTAIDLTTRKVLWQKPFGTTQDLAPLGIAVPGAFNIAGSVATAGGVLFIGASIDQYLRAFDMKDGRELWRGRLPAGGQAGPMTYVSKKTGRQYVVITAGGHQMLKTPVGDYLVAYALPR